MKKPIELFCLGVLFKLGQEFTCGPGLGMAGEVNHLSGKVCQVCISSKMLNYKVIGSPLHSGVIVNSPLTTQLIIWAEFNLK